MNFLPFLIVNLNHNRFFTRRVYIFADRNLEICFCIENVHLHPQLNFYKEIPTP
jgi:hypothetical protein